MWQTKSARFYASRRLKDTKKWVTRATSFASVYLIIGALSPHVGVVELTPTEYSYWSIGIAGLSLIILVLSLLEHHRDYSVRAHRLHECGVRLNALYNEYDALFRSGTNITLTQVQDYGKKYSDIVGEYSDVNHRPIDFRWFRAEHPDEFDLSKIRSNWMRATIWARIIGPYFAMVVLPPVAVLYLLL